VASWWHLSLVAVSGGVCWWRETTTKLTRKPQSMLCERQQNII